MESAQRHIDTVADEDGASKGVRKNFKIREIPTEFSDVDSRIVLGTIKHDGNTVELNQLKLAKYTKKYILSIKQLISFSTLCQSPLHNNVKHKVQSGKSKIHMKQK